MAKRTPKPKPEALSVSITVPDDVKVVVALPDLATKLTDATVVTAKTWHDEAKIELKRRKAVFEKLKKPLNELRANVLALEKQSCTPLEESIEQVGNLLVLYQLEKDRERREAEARAQKEADERARVEREQQLAALKAAAQATEIPEHREAIQQQATQIAAAPLRAVPRAVTYVPRPIVNIPTRTTWHAEVYDFNALVMATAIPLLLKLFTPEIDPTCVVVDALRALGEKLGAGGVAYLLPNDTALNVLAVSCQDSLPIAGVRGVSKTTPITARATVVEPVRVLDDDPPAQSLDDFKL